MKFLLSILLILAICNNQANASWTKDTTAHKKNRKLIILATGVNAAYITSLVVLNEVWYKNNPRSSFHFFNDNNEWLQMDKIGHFTTSFQESAFAVKALQWAGLPEKKSIWIGSLTGFIYQSPIEVLDGYSKEYGASWGDLIANASGSAMVLGQYLAWNEIRIQPKFSFHQTNYHLINPNLLGKSLNEQIIKDYNGQTYWLSFNIYSFLRKKDSGFPKWLNVALGYGGQNMVRAQREQSESLGYSPYRQYYLSFDIDFSRTRFRKKWIKYVLYPLNFIHIPFPAMEFNKHKIIFHPIYF